MMSKDKHAAPRPRGREGRSTRRPLRLALALGLIMALFATAMADYQVGDQSSAANNASQCSQVDGTFVNGGNGPGSVPSTCTFTVEGELVTFIINPGEVETGWHLKGGVIEVEVSQGGHGATAINPGEVTNVVVIEDGGCYNPGGKLMKPGKGLCPQPDA